jgi:hypothetical protein
LLPFCYRNAGRAVYSGPDRGVNLGRGIVLHAGQDMAVEVERDPNARMAKAFLRHLGVDPIRQKVRRVGVPQIMEPDAWQIASFPEQPNELMREAIRLERLAIHLRDDVGLVAKADANPQEFPRLLKTGSPQLVSNQGRQGDGSSPPALGLFGPDALRGLLGALYDGNLLTAEIDRAPAQSSDLAAPQAAHNGEQDRNEHPRISEVGEQPCCLGSVKGRHLSAAILKVPCRSVAIRVFGL